MDKEMTRLEGLVTGLVSAGESDASAFKLATDYRRGQLQLKGGELTADGEGMLSTQSLLITQALSKGRGTKRAAEEPAPRTAPTQPQGGVQIHPAWALPPPQMLIPPPAPHMALPPPPPMAPAPGGRPPGERPPPTGVRLLQAGEAAPEGLSRMAAQRGWRGIRDGRVVAAGSCFRCGVVDADHESRDCRVDLAALP